MARTHKKIVKKMLKVREKMSRVKSKNMMKMLMLPRENMMKKRRVRTKREMWRKVKRINRLDIWWCTTIVLTPPCSTGVYRFKPV